MALSARPSRRNMDAPEHAEYPDCPKGECTVQRQPPRFERAYGRSEGVSMNDDVVEQEPQDAREPDAGPDSVDSNSTGARQPRRAAGAGSRFVSHAVAPKCCQSPSAPSR